MAARVGVSHVTLERFLAGGGKPEPSVTTLARIQAWLEQPQEAEVAHRWRRDLRRLLGPLPAGKYRDAEAAVGRVFEEYLREAGEQIPEWVLQLGKKQR